MRALAALSLLAVAGADGAALAQEARTHFAEGWRLTDDGRDGRPAFARAAVALQAESAAHGAAPEHWLNLGNAAYLADDLPRALAAFQRGLALAPQHPRLREHLGYARGQVNLPKNRRGAPEPDPWPAWLPRWSPACWFVTLTALHTFGCALAAVGWVRRARGWWLAALVAWCGAGLAAYALLIVHQERALDGALPLVVVRADTTLHTGNGASYPRQSELPLLVAGMEARLRTERGGWVQVQFATGEIGWINAAQVLVAR